jgi:hypothetical protein
MSEGFIDEKLKGLPPLVAGRWRSFLLSMGYLPAASTRTHEPGLALTQKAANFAASAAKHVAAGMPKATDEQVAARFAICQGCEHFDGKACRKCGCPVVRERKFLSKLSWAGESCPVGKWGPVSS